jgi:flavin-dependent dehydrogenase
MNVKTDAIVIGGGLAGLTAALHLLKRDCSVTVIEKDSYPHHKVCGEYLSAEVLPYLEWLGADVKELSPVSIRRLLFTTATGRESYAQLPLGGMGISRFALDNFLYNKALALGCRFIHDAVGNVRFDGSAFDIHLVSGEHLSTALAIGAYGKRTLLDQNLGRDFIQKKSPWLAVKAHYEGEFPDDLVALHHFKGGYCGVSKVENGRINICYLADYASFKKFKHIDAYQKGVLYKNPHLEKLFVQSRMIFDKPLTISQISFGEKDMVQDHMLMVGDAAGLIHPLSGNGMAMAVHGAKICAELGARYLASAGSLNGDIHERSLLEHRYRQQWQQTFRARLRISRMLSGILRNERLTELSVRGISRLPFLLPMIVRKTHGNPLTAEA